MAPGNAGEMVNIKPKSRVHVAQHGGPRPGADLAGLGEELGLAARGGPANRADHALAEDADVREPDVPIWSQHSRKRTDECETLSTAT